MGMAGRLSMELNSERHAGAINNLPRRAVKSAAQSRYHRQFALDARNKPNPLVPLNQGPQTVYN